MRMTIYPSRVIGGVLGMHSITELHRWELRTGQTPQHARCSLLALLGAKLTLT